MIIWAISLKREQNTDIEILLDFYIKAQITIKKYTQKRTKHGFLYVLLGFGGNIRDHYNLSSGTVFSP